MVIGLRSGGLIIMRERDIEKRVCAIARSKGWWPIKIGSIHQRGVPDRMFLNQGRLVFVEFKRAGRKPTKLQACMLNRLEGLGFPVRVVDNVRDVEWLN